MDNKRDLDRYYQTQTNHIYLQLQRTIHEVANIDCILTNQGDPRAEHWNHVFQMLSEARDTAFPIVIRDDQDEV